MYGNKIIIKNKIVGDSQIPPPITTNFKRWEGYKEKYIDTIGNRVIRKAYVKYQTSSFTVHKVFNKHG